MFSWLAKQSKGREEFDGEHSLKKKRKQTVKKSTILSGQFIASGKTGAVQV